MICARDPYGCGFFGAMMVVGGPLILFARWLMAWFTATLHVPPDAHWPRLGLAVGSTILGAFATMLCYILLAVVVACVHGGIVWLISKLRGGESSH